MLKTSTSLVLMAALLVACSGPKTSPSSQETDSETESTGLTGALGRMAQGLQEAAKAVEDLQNANIEPVAYESLRDLLPTSAAGITRTEATGEKAGAMGMSMSFAEGEYFEDGSGRHITIKITDAGSMSSMLAFGMAWVDMNIDRESDSSFERTGEFEGFKSFQKFDSSGHGEGEIIILVANRFVVDVKGRVVSFDELLGAARSVDLKALERRKGEGVTPLSDS